MPEPMDDFERDLADRLRGWTEPASRRRDFAAAAQELIASERTQRQPRFLLRIALAATTIMAAVALVGVFVSIAPPRAPAASTSPSASALPSPEPSAMAGRDLDLADITWYTLVSVGFGSFTEPGPDDPPLPEGYDELTVGTLDGHVTTELHLTTRVTEDGHEGAWANGPYGSSVLVGDDDGTRSRVFTVSSVDASESTILATDDAVVVGALGTDEMYFVPLGPRILEIHARSSGAFDHQSTHRKIELARGYRDHSIRRFGSGCRFDFHQLLRRRLPLRQEGRQRLRGKLAHRT